MSQPSQHWSAVPIRRRSQSFVVQSTNTLEHQTWCLPKPLRWSLPCRLAMPSVIGRRLPSVGLRSGHRSSTGCSNRYHISNFTRHISPFRIGPLPCPALRLHPCPGGPFHGDRPCSPCLRRIPRRLASPSRYRSLARLGRSLRSVVARAGILPKEGDGIVPSLPSASPPGVQRGGHRARCAAASCHQSSDFRL